MWLRLKSDRRVDYMNAIRPEDPGMTSARAEIAKLYFSSELNNA